MPQGKDESLDIVPAFRKMPINQSIEEDELSELSDEGHIPITQNKDPPLTVEHQADDKPVDFESERSEEGDDAPTGDVGDEELAHEISIRIAEFAASDGEFPSVWFVMKPFFLSFAPSFYCLR